MEVWENRKYQSHKVDNYDEYLKSVGVNFMTRKLAVLLVPIIELLKEGEEFVLRTFTIYKNLVMKFKLDEEFEEETMDGRMIKSIITREKNVFTQKYRDGPIVIVREFHENECIETISNGKVVCTRQYAVMK